MVDVPMDKTGQASGSQSTARQVGSALGIAVIGTALFSGTEVALDQSLEQTALTSEQSSIVVETVVDSAGSAIPGLEQILAGIGVDPALAQQIQDVSGQAFTQAAGWAAYVAAAFLVVGFFSTLRLGSSARMSPESGKPTKK